MLPDNEKEESVESSLSPAGTLGELDETLHGLMFETSPYGNLDAIVQHDGRAVYFYLNGDESFGTRACWVRNLVEAPYVLNEDDLQQGVPPVMPRTHCRTAGAQPMPDVPSLRTVWFEEGNGAALFEGDHLLAVIPPWSGTDGFHGYSHECIAEGPIAWPLMENRQLRLRIENAKAFWHSCSSENEHPFAELQSKLLSIYQERFGSSGEYFAMDNRSFPPRGASLYRHKDQIWIATVGMSFRPQPNVEMAVEEPSSYRRIELAIELKTVASTAELQPLLEQVSGLVAYPWKAQTWFGHGHTCQLNALIRLLGTEYDSAAFVSDQVKNSTAPIEMPNFRHDLIQLLWLVPISGESE